MNCPHMQRARGASCALIALSGVLPAYQQQVCHSDSIPLMPTDWAETLTLPRFDPELGILTSIDFVLTAEEQGSAGVESLDNMPTTVTTSFQAMVSVTHADMSLVVVTIPAVVFTDFLTPFDGILDYAGDSGETHGGIVESRMETSSTATEADLALFTGPAGNPGTIDLSASAAGISSATGSGNLTSLFATSAAADLVVCYNYELDCNDNGIPDPDDISGGESHDVTGDGVPDECQPDTSSFCEGDGAANGGADCPCMNEGGAGEGCMNGTGTGALMTASGVPSVSNDTLTLTVTGVAPTMPGYFFFGTTLAGDGSGVPFGSGLRCLDFAVRVLKQDGGGTIPTGGKPSISMLLSIQPGATNYFQYWYRDPVGPCAGLSANTTNGIRVTWGL